MKPAAEQLDAIDAAKHEQAEAMHPIERALAGARLYDIVRRRMAWGVKMERPDADAATIDRLVIDRLDDLWEAENR